MTIADRIKMIMKSKGYTAYKLSQEAQITTGCLSKLFNDGVEPKISTLRKIAKELNVSLVFLLGEEDSSFAHISPMMSEYLKGFSIKEQEMWLEKNYYTLKNLNKKQKKNDKESKNK